MEHGIPRGHPLTPCGGKPLLFFSLQKVTVKIITLNSPRPLARCLAACHLPCAPMLPITGSLTHSLTHLLFCCFYCPPYTAPPVQYHRLPGNKAPLPAVSGAFRHRWEHLLPLAHSSPPPPLLSPLLPPTASSILTLKTLSCSVCPRFCPITSSPLFSFAILFLTVFPALIIRTVPPPLCFFLLAPESITRPTDMTLRHKRPLLSSLSQASPLFLSLSPSHPTHSLRSRAPLILFFHSLALPLPLLSKNNAFNIATPTDLHRTISHPGPLSSSSCICPHSSFAA